MKALLLNSGLGSRMGKETEDKPKCMCHIGNGYTIISWQLELLRQNGVKDVIITTGPFSELLEEHVLMNGKGLNVVFVKNPVYTETNYIYSIYLARKYLTDDILLLHGDLVLESSVVKDLISSAHSAVTVDRLLSLPEKDFKARIENGKIRAIGIEYFGEDCEACQPAYKWSEADFNLFLNEIEKFCNTGKLKVYAEAAFNSISNNLNLYPLELADRLCNEIDNLDDLGMISKRFMQIIKGC